MKTVKFQWSPSSRRAWIEILNSFDARDTIDVALLAEGVDRNSLPTGLPSVSGKSPSSRRAWIEIIPPLKKPEKPRVALLDFAGLTAHLESPSSRRAWIEILRMAL